MVVEVGGSEQINCDFLFQFQSVDLRLAVD